MNKYIKSMITPLGVFLASSVFVLANATTVGELNNAIDIAKDFANAEDCTVERIVFASGTQNYTRLPGPMWSSPSRPLAALYDIILGAEGDEIELLLDEKIGAHYQHLRKPAWEFTEGRVIVESGRAITGYPGVPGVGNVAWLDVDTEDGSLGRGLGHDLGRAHGLGYDKLFRVLTDSGVAKNIGDYSDGEHVGFNYSTYYVFLSCPTPPSFGRP